MINQQGNLVLSIRQPWAWLICNGWKNVENRNWPTKVRGRVLIHAAKGMDSAEWEAAYLFVAGFAPGLAASIPRNPERGGIVGSAVILDCVTYHPSDWFCGPYGFVLDDQKALPFVQCAGRLGFFSFPTSLGAAASAPSSPAVGGDLFA